MDVQTAEATSILLLKVSAVLDAQLANIQQSCEPDEFKQQRRLFGASMAGLLDIVNSIYQEHPRLKPIQLGGTYELPNAVLAQSVSQLVDGA